MPGQLFPSSHSNCLKCFPLPPCEEFEGHGRNFFPVNLTVLLFPVNLPLVTIIDTETTIDHTTKTLISTRQQRRRQRDRACACAMDIINGWT